MAGDNVRLAIVVPRGYTVVYGKKKLKALLRKAGAEVAAAARALVRNSSGSGRSYRGGGHPYRPGAYVASAPGQAPVSVGGRLAASIKVRPSRDGESVSIRDLAPEALFLEKGAKGRGRRILAPRPFLTVALDQRRASLEERIKASVVDDIEFRRVK
jgi:hypothetical protein